MYFHLNSSIVRDVFVQNISYNADSKKLGHCDKPKYKQTTMICKSFSTDIQLNTVQDKIFNRQTDTSLIVVNIYSHVSDEFGQEQQKTGKVIECLKNTSLSHSTGKQVN